MVTSVKCRPRWRQKGSRSAPTEKCPFAALLPLLVLLAGGVPALAADSIEDLLQQQDETDSHNDALRRDLNALTEAMAILLQDRAQATRHRAWRPSTNRRSRQSTYRAVCGKRATLLGNVDRADRKPRCGAELTKRQDVKPPGIRGRGGIVGIPLPNILD